MDTRATPFPRAMSELSIRLRPIPKIEPRHESPHSVRASSLEVVAVETVKKSRAGSKGGELVIPLRHLPLMLIKMISKPSPIPGLHCSTQKVRTRLRILGMRFSLSLSIPTPTTIPSVKIHPFSTCSGATAISTRKMRSVQQRSDPLSEHTYISSANNHSPPGRRLSRYHCDQLEDSYS